MVGFRVGNTLSESGTVSRGVCSTNEYNYLTGIVERTDISRVDGKISFTGDNGFKVTTNERTPVSMNMWGLTPDFLDTLEAGFPDFLANAVPQNPLKAEYLLPIYIGQLLRENRVKVKVLRTNDKWFGVTYQEDKPLVMQSIRDLIQSGVYGEDLYGDLQ